MADIASATADSCASHCASLGYTYFGTQWYGECFCDNNYGDYGEATNCDTPCDTNSQEMCGGAWQTVFTKSPLQAWTEMHMSVLTNGRHVNVPVGCDMVLMIPSQTGLRSMDPSNVPMTYSEIHFMEPS